MKTWHRTFVTSKYPPERTGGIKKALKLSTLTKYGPMPPNAKERKGRPKKAMSAYRPDFLEDQTNHHTQDTKQTMKIHDLIERLEGYRDLYGPNCEVRLQTQPNWPFENTIAGLVSGSEINDSDDDDDNDVEQDTVVYIIEGTQLGYGSKTAWNLI